MTPRAVIRWGIAAGGFALYGCGGDPAPEAPARYAQDGTLPAGVRAKERPDVVIVAISAMRYDVTLGGVERVQPMPRLAAFAQDAAVFDNAASTAGWEGPSFASLLTSLEPCDHGVLAPVEESRQQGDLLPAIVTIPEILSAQGWATIAAGDALNFGVGSGFEQGFDRYLLSALLDQSVSDSYEWIASRPAGTPHLLVIHVRATDGQAYAWPERKWVDPAMARTKHLERLGKLDEHLGRLFARIDEGDAGRGTVVFVLADCGEALGEPAAGGKIGRGGSVRDEVLHVPLVLRAKGRVRSGRVAGSCSVTDVAPTVLDLVGLPPLAEASGRSLLPLIASPKDPGRPVGARDRVGPIELFAVRTAEAKFVARRDTVTRTWVEQMYDLRADPREERPLPGARASDFGGEFLRAVDALRERLRKADKFAEGVKPPYVAPATGC